MNVRRILGSFFSVPATRVLRNDIREIVEQVLSTRSFAMPSEVWELRNEVDRLKAERPAPTDGLAERVAQLEKKLSMALGAVQASSATVMQTRTTAEEALATARQAHQLATTARATAESAAEGVGSLEDKLAPEQPVTAAVRVDDRCQVADCTEKHRAKGFCARHYQQWRRGVLPGFPLDAVS